MVVTPMSWVTFLEADADCSPLSNRSSVAVIERSMSLLLAGYDLWTNRSALPMIGRLQDVHAGRLCPAKPSTV